MSNDSIKARTGEGILSGLDKLPIISFYARTRGEAFVVSWFHRIAGIALAIFVWMHLLSSFTTPAFYESRIALLALAIVLIFHSFNGGRLILYEVFGVRNEGSMMHWVWGLSLLYVLFVALLMVIGNQEVSTTLFWLIVFVSGLILCFSVASRVWRSEHTVVWKVQRITGALLLMLVPAHIVLMHVNAPVAHQASAMIVRMQEIFLKVVDIALLLALLYHGGYGLISVITDYLSSRGLRIGAALLIIFVMALCAAVRF
jgi:succinate dehydrogenase hydrophobic membrane anchor protein